MSRKKQGGGRVTAKGTKPAAASAKRTGTPARPTFPGQGRDPFAATARSVSAPMGPTRAGHHRGNR